MQAHESATGSQTSRDTCLAAEGVFKHYDRICALAGVDFELRRGEVHALLGQNGAGKSTLVRILSGAEAPDSGRILLAGEEHAALTPIQAHGAGIRIIHQERLQCPDLSVAENLALGALPTRRGVVDWPQLARSAAETLASLGVAIDPDSEVSRLTRAEQQIVEVARAVHQDASIILMDEPTAALSHQETDRLLQVVIELRDRGVAILYISHQLQEVARVADRITVLRDGAVVGEFVGPETGTGAVAEAMLGRDEVLHAGNPYEPVLNGSDSLSVAGYSGKGFRDVSFTLRRGEILALTGLLGAGHIDLARTLVGAETPESGELRVGGDLVRIRTPADANELGIGYVPADRKTEGLIRDLTVAENAVLADVARSRRLVMTDAWMSERCGPILQALSVKAPDLNAPIGTLSGGNQQKLVLAKWILSGARVLVLVEPTSGVDVGAKVEIFGTLRDVASGGVSILLVSSDFDEVERLATSAIVFRKGAVVAQFSAQEISSEVLFKTAVA